MNTEQREIHLTASSHLCGRQKGYVIRDLDKGYLLDMCTQGSPDFTKMPNSRIWSTQEMINESEGGKRRRIWSELYFTFRSRLPVPALVFGLFFGKPVAVDHWAGFCLENSCGCTGASPRGRMAREGSLLRRTWRGISVEGWGRGWGGKGRLEITAC